MSNQCMWRLFLRVTIILITQNSIQDTLSASSGESGASQRANTTTTRANLRNETIRVTPASSPEGANTTEANIHDEYATTAAALCNTSGNSSTNKTCKPDDKTQTRTSDGLTTKEVLLICGFAFTFVVGVLGNIFVCYIFGYKRRKYRSVTETLLLYLGIVDLLASIVNPFLFVYWTKTRYKRWDFGLVGCKILAPLAPITVTISATIIIIVCLDRYRAIVSPFKARYSRRQINVFVAIAVVISVLSYTGYIIHLEVLDDWTCLVPKNTALGYAVPYIVITVLRDLGYTVVFCFTSVAIYGHLNVNEKIQANTQYIQKRRRDSKRICRMLFCIGVVFALLVFPKDALSLASILSWLTSSGFKHTSTIVYLNAWLKVLNVSNSCVNVFIYSQMHARFKRELFGLLGICVKTKSNLPSSTLVTQHDYDDSSNPDMKQQEMQREDVYRGNMAQRGTDIQDGENKIEVIKLGDLNGCSEADVLINSERM
eukprot:gene10985-12148_t